MVVCVCVSAIVSGVCFGRCVVRVNRGGFALLEVRSVSHFTQYICKYTGMGFERFVLIVYKSSKSEKVALKILLFIIDNRWFYKMKGK